MRTIPQAWRQEYIKGNRKYDVTVNMTLADGTTLTIENDQIWEGGFSYEQASSSDSSFDIGSAVIGSATLVLDNINENFSEYDFFNAEFNVSVGLVGTNLQHITIGHFTVDETSYNGSLITLTCLDNMWRFDRPFSEITTVSYPATARSLINAMCAYSGIGIQLATQSFQGYDYAINSAPEEDMTCREVLQYVAQATCNYCVINQQGNLELRWYDKSAINNITDYDGGSFSTNTTPYSDGDTVDGGTFAFNDGDNVDGGSFYEPSSIAYITSNYSMSVDTDDIVITGVKVCTSDTESEEGYDYSWHDSTLEQTHPRYTLIIQDNPFINKNNASSRATTIGGIIAGTPLRGFSSSSLSDISIEVGDPCAIIDFRGNRFYSFVTNTRFQTSNAESFSCGVESLTQNKTVRYSNEIKTLVEAKRNAQEVVSDYDQSVQRMHQLAANASGLYWLEVPQQDGSVIWYESDMPMSLDSSGNVVFTNHSHAWKRTSNGFFSCTSTGTSEATTTWTAGIDNNNNAVMNTVSAIGINADWINAGSLNAARITAGILKDQYNYNYWNLSTGEFRLAALPANQTIYDPNADYSGAYVPTNSNAPASSWTAEQKAANVGKTFVNTSTNKTYIYKATSASLPESEHNPYSDNVDDYYHFTIDSSISNPVLHFNSQCATEGNDYDYVDIYQTGSGYWGKVRLQGNSSSFGSKNIQVNDEFWLHWHTDTSQHNYYGWKIDSIDSSGGDYVDWQDVSGKPSATWIDVTYPTTASYQWVEASLEEYIDVKASQQEQQDLTQEEIFNILTNNGQTQGLFLQNGKVYLNGEYFATNALTIGRNPTTGLEPYLKICNSSGTEIGRWDKNGIEANAGKFGKLHVYKDSNNNQTYLRYVTNKTYKYVDKSWSTGGITNDNRFGEFIVNPFREGWLEDGYIDFNFSMNTTSTATQCTVWFYKYIGGTKSRIRTVELRADGKSSGGIKGLEYANCICDHTFGENDGDYYRIRYEVVRRTVSATLEANDGGRGSSFIIKENGSEEAVCSGKFFGEFKGSEGSFRILDLGVFKYQPTEYYDGCWKIKGDNNEYGEISEQQISLSSSEDFDSSSQGVMLQQGNIFRRYNSNSYTPEWTSSDRRIKRDIEPLSVKLSKDFIDGTEPKSFRYRNDDAKNYGMIAQEARELLDSLGETDSALEYGIGDTDIKDQRTIAYSQYIPHLINYVKDLRSEIDELKEEIRTLKGDSE